MSDQRCEVVEHVDPLLGFRMRVTLQSPLDCQRVQARLSRTFPKFQVPPDYSTLAGPRPRIYVGSLRGTAIQLDSAGYLGKRHPVRLAVRGTIEPRGQGSLIRLGVYSPRVIVSKLVVIFMGIAVLAFGVDLWFGVFGFVQGGSRLFGALAFGVMALPLVGVPCVAVIAIRARARRESAYLLAHLQSLLGPGS